MLKKWFRLFTSKPANESLENKAELPNARIPTNTRLENIRFIVLDFETTGLNIRKDKPLSLGAVAIEALKIQLNQQFECIFYQQHNQPAEATLVHGLTPKDIQAGENAAEGLKKFYHFAGNAVLVAFHAPFDQQILSRASQQNLHFTPQYQFLDLADIAPAYFRQFAQLKGLDKWCEALQIDRDFDRHHAAADALAASAILLMSLKEAAKQGDHTLKQLQSKVNGIKRLHQQHRFL